MTSDLFSNDFNSYSKVRIKNGTRGKRESNDEERRWRQKEGSYLCLFHKVSP